MSLRDQLQNIYNQHGELTPGLLVDEARDNEHPLHHRFEWDDRLAGESWRRQQAHELIRSVTIVYRDEKGHDQQIRAFHAIRGATGHVYEPLETVVQNTVMTELLRREMERDWRALKKRYDGFEEFLELIRRDLDAA